MYPTLTEYLDHWSERCPDTIWLRDLQGDDMTEWSWQAAREEIHAIGAWLEQHFASTGNNIGILSRNRAHWIVADLGAIASGNVTIPMFTTLAQDTARYVIEFSDMQLLFVGETENWDAVAEVLPADIQLVCLPGVEIEQPHLRLQDLIETYRGQSPGNVCQAEDLITIVFTSGTTGVPKGVMQTHESFVLPIDRFLQAFAIREHGRYLSYLPLSHIAERQLIEGSSLMTGGVVNFNESLLTLLRDLTTTRPHFMFGAPRVWEQLQQVIIGQFGSQEDLDAALDADKAAVGQQVREMLGLDEADYLLTAAAPTPPALIHWYEEFGLVLMEGFGQTEAMGLIANSHEARKIGSIGRPIEGVEIRLSDEDELQVRAGGCATGYYKNPEKTAETFVDGWVYTGDKAQIDEDGFVYITGRVKDYFKTIQGKFVAPPPIEGAFSDNPHTEQLCLLGRGYSKTVMVCVLSDLAQQRDRDTVAEELREMAHKVNATLDKHERIGALVISCEPWNIENALLTPTLKMRREQIEQVFGERAQALAHKAAVQGELLVEWH
ncbi:MAG: AMP-binding protein [Gammaproteobacteria bacterium]|nr:AMP-binding protein [Gammaproteobacteria bacterium]